ncbi:MAG: sugar phosphate nucleotidyltransferase, partial [Clostridium sp.]
EDDIKSDEFMKINSINVVPIVNKEKKIISIDFTNRSKIHKDINMDIPVVIIAGGKGTRLAPYTNILPKPLIPIGDETITEHIMNNFENFGCTKFNIIVNYKKNLIKSFFKDNDTQRNIEFYDETEYRGTGGGLKLLLGNIKSTFFMTNCDILIDEDYSDMINFHKRNKNIITIVSAMKNVTIPYGTIDIDGKGIIVGMKEKPTYSFMANTGLYIIEPEFLELIPERFVHITEVIQFCIDKGMSVGTYPISEYGWMDMGQLEELEKMKRRIDKNM